MTEETKTTFSVVARNQEETSRVIERLYEVIQPETVFSKPKKVGDYTIITASEVTVGVGAGYGYGSYSPSDEEAENRETEEETAVGEGGGGGGGGLATGRPVAVISVGPEGVNIQPVLDRTKFGIALVSAVGSMFLALSRMKK
jgi:uncharacterized spore protein YtfJ